MSSILLFSELTDTNREAILNMLFVGNAKDQTFAYMPSSGVRGSEPYIAQWETIANEHGTNFVTIDNTSNDAEEQDKLLTSDVLLISGGNTFQLLYNLRRSGLDNTVIKFSQKQNFVLAGFSAGALVLTPTINICNPPGFDENLVGLEDLNGLNLIDFEVFPHYNKDIHSEALANYQEVTGRPVKAITNEGYILVNL